ncbi:MAG: LVIVD repeat-containing protein [Anaerolineaceae bacterium]
MNRKTINNLIVCFILCIVIVSCQSSHGENSLTSAKSAGFSLIGQLGGSSMTVAVTDDLAVMGQGPRVVILDVSNPENPAPLGESEVLPGLVMGIEVIGDYAYATTMYGGLNILDISNPSKPELISSVTPTYPGCNGITIEENIAYMACNPSGLFIVDIRDPKAPEILFQETTPVGSVISIAHVGNYIYMTNLTTSGLDIINVENPKTPIHEGVFNNSEVPGVEDIQPQYYSVKPCGKNLCLGGGSYAFFILDLTDPVKPKALDWLPMYVSGMVVDGNTVYLSAESDGNAGIYTVDISNPEKLSENNLIPEEIGGWELWGFEMGERGMFLQNDLLFITDEVNGLTIANVGNPKNAVRVGYYMTPLPNVLFKIQLKDDNAFLVSNLAGFRTVDISDPSNPRELAYDDGRKYISSQGPTGLVIRDDYAYISDMSSDYKLRIYDVSNPANPRQTGVVETPVDVGGGSAYDVVLNGNFAYLSSQGVLENEDNSARIGIWVIDIEDSNNPVPVNFVDVPNQVWELSLVKNYLYALDISMGNEQPEPISLRIFDLSNPQEPIQVNTVDITDLRQGWNHYKMLIDEDRLYISTSPIGVLVFDISKPAKPELITTIPIMTNSQGLSKNKQYLFADGMNAYDISNLEKPDVTGIYFLDVRDIEVKDDLVYVATPFQGMYILKFDPVSMGQFVIPDELK